MAKRRSKVAIIGRKRETKKKGARRWVRVLRDRLTTLKAKY